MARIFQRDVKERRAKGGRR